jgi:hypothetical protein
MNGLLIRDADGSSHVGTAALSATATENLIREYEALGYEVTEVAA